MCGIGGFYSATGRSAPVDAIASLWAGLESRGTHAAGFALHWHDADDLIVKKGPVAASNMVGELKHYCGSGDNTQYGLLHTRFTTQGSTKNNKNNHPVVRDGIVLTHNGVLRNDKEIFHSLGEKRTAQVDTEAINAALRCESPQWTIENVEGSMSIAWVDTQDSTKTVHLMTNGNNPLVIARTNDGDIVWASTEDILRDSVEDLVDWDSMFHALPYKQYSLMPDGTIRSKFISDLRAEPDLGISWRGWYTGGSTGASRGIRSVKVAKRSKKGRRKAQKVSRAGRVGDFSRVADRVYATCDSSGAMYLVEVDDPDLYYTRRGWRVGSP